MPGDGGRAAGTHGGRRLLEILRAAESEQLRAELTGPAPSLTVLIGPEGAGKSTTVLNALAGLDAVRYWAAPLPDADHRALLVSRLARWRDPSARPSDAEELRSPAPEGEALPLTAEWPRIFEHLTLRAAERTRPLRLVLEEYPRLAEARPRLPAEIERFWAGVRARGLPVHLVLAGPLGPVFDRLLEEGSTLGGWVGSVIPVEPLTYREVGALFPSYAQRDRLLTWMIFGGLLPHLRPLDPALTLATNVRQAVLAHDAPLLRAGTEHLQRWLQSVPRYASLLRSLSAGRREWGEILAGTPELGSGGQMAPYLAKLQQLGLAIGEASLDARAGSRSRRYRIADPFLWFWHRFVLPNLSDLLSGQGADVWRLRIRSQLDEYAALLFPLACREYLMRYAQGRLPASARELGGLWGADYDIELAGTLRTGAAFYGKAHWGRGKIPEVTDERLQEEVRRTRYGFGKEARLRVVFSTDGFSQGLLRRGARSDSMHLIGVDALFGA